MRVRDIAQFIHVSLSSHRGRASLEHKSISTSYRGQRYNIDSTLQRLYTHISPFFSIIINLFSCACQSYSDVSSNNQCSYHAHAPLLLLHSNSLVLDDLSFYFEVIYVIFIYEFNGYAIYEMEAM